MSTRLSALDLRDDGRPSLDVALGEVSDEAPEEDAAAVLHRLCAGGQSADMRDFLAEMSEDDLDEQDLEEGLAIASHGGHAECVELLLKCGASPKSSAPDGGTTPLHVASQSGSAACVNLLVEAGADVNAADSLSGATATYVAACHGNTDCIELLLAADASPDLARSRSGTASDLARPPRRGRCTTCCTAPTSSSAPSSLTTAAARRQPPRRCRA